VELSLEEVDGLEAAPWMADPGVVPCEGVAAVVAAVVAVLLATVAVETFL